MKPLNILLIEDSNLLANITMDMISFKNKNITHVQKLKDAIELVKKSRNWHVFLFDLNLLDSDRDNTINHLRPFSKVAPVIVLSSEHDVVDKCKSMGACEFFHKGNFTKDELNDTIKKAVTMWAAAKKKAK